MKKGSHHHPNNKKRPPNDLENDLFRVIAFEFAFESVSCGKKREEKAVEGKKMHLLSALIAFLTCSTFKNFDTNKIVYHFMMSLMTK